MEPDHISPEPRLPRACSTPHSAPLAWLRAEPATAQPDDALEPVTPEQQHRENVDTFLAAYERIAPEAERRDGWTPFLRRLFLEVIAETGRVALACEYTGISRSSAYALQARDRVFAAGWDAAVYFARGPIADDIYEKGLTGISETVTRSDGVTVTRHRYDGRLSVAVLSRLDRRCDRAEERGSVHLAAVRNWEEYLRLVGSGDDKAAEALLDRRQDCPACPLPERANPIPLPDPPGHDPGAHIWKSEEGIWMTSFPPPPGFTGHADREWDGFNHYERACTPEEAELLDAHQAAAEAEEMAELTAQAEDERDRFFAGLRTAIDRS